ncbi:MAG: heme-binding protein [Chloracidobacterium sp.]|nr:heme-binding protein [Chloracidobacterium sp.]
MSLHFGLNLRRLVLAVIALLSFGAVIIKQSDQYLRVSAASQSLMSVNAASYLGGPLARGSLASIFGNNLSSTTEESRSNPAPTTLGGVTLQVTDSAGVTFDAQLVYVSPKQINYVIPDEVTGRARIVIKKGADSIAEGDLNVVDSSPALFTTGSDHKMAAGMTGVSGASSGSVVNPDGSPRAVRIGTPWNPSVVTLLGTGLRYASNLKVRIGGEELTPTSVTPDPDTPGVDQVEVKLPMTVSGGINTLSLVVNTTPTAATQSSPIAPASATQSTAAAATTPASAAPSTSTAQTSNAAQLLVQPDAPPSAFQLNAADVQQIIAQAVAKAQQIGLPVTIAVTDKEANVLGLFKMNGARSDVLVGATNLVTGQPTKQLVNGMPDPDGLEQVRLPLAQGLGLLSDGAALAAVSKAGTGAFFSTQGSAITTRTASDIIQENFPVGIQNQAAGPLFGVQFSQLPCSDVAGLVSGSLPLGLAGDPGGAPVYKNGVAVGGVGVEGDGFYSVDLNNMDFDQRPEEAIAIAAIKGFRPAPALQANNLLVGGVQLHYVNVPIADGPAPAPLDSTTGAFLSPIRSTPVSKFTQLTLAGVPGRVIMDTDPNPVATGVRQGYFPFKSSAVSALTADDVTRIISQAAQTAYRSRAAIRLPVPLPVEVNISVVDTSGVILGIFSTNDAPQFGFDVCVQKARTSTFFSTPTAGALLRSAEGGKFAKFADAALAFGVKLDGSVAFSERANGFLSRPYFPDGIIGTMNGPFSKPINIWSPFNVGLQLALDRTALVSILTGGPIPTSCTAIPSLGTGIQIFAGGVPLFKNGVLVGGIGVSGDGTQQDDLVASGGSFGYEAPQAMRVDQLTPFGVRLPYVQFPAHPGIGTLPANPPIFKNTRAFANPN